MILLDLDPLAYSASFFSVSVDTDDFGEEKKIFTPLYENIKCKVRDSKNASGSVRPTKGEEQTYQEGYKIIVESKYNGAKIGDKVVYENEPYIITKKWEQKAGNFFDYIFYFVDRWEN